jgi:purine/pyrimidine-nucleoside phosphorylase
MEDTVFKVNEYFDGNVKSIAFQSAEGPATVGVLAKGEYEFGTSTREIMIVTTGKLTVKLPDVVEWREYKPFEKFEVDAGRKFQVRIDEQSSYICFYK